MIRVAFLQAVASVRNDGPVELLRLVFVSRSRNFFVQLIRYGIVGAVSAAADTGTLLTLSGALHVNYIAAGTVGFVIGTLVNYALSVLWVFHRTSQPYVEIAGFVLIGAAGLVINDVTLWFGQSVLRWDLFWAKMLAIVVGFLWNFILRKVMFDRLHRFLDKRTSPDASDDAAASPASIRTNEE